MLEEAGIGAKIVFDTTYGEGRFYGAFRPEIELLIGADIEVHNWVVEPDLFIKRPTWLSWKIVKRIGIRPDIVVVDPPFGFPKGGRKSREHYYRYSVFSRIILEEALKSARKLGVDYVLIHYPRYLKIEGWETVIVKEFMYIARYLKQNPENPKTTYFFILKRHI